MNGNFIIDIYIHVILLFIFLTLFFIFYVAKLSTDAFQHEIDHSVSTIVTDYINKLKPSEKNYVKIAINNLPIDKLLKNYNKPSEYIQEHNWWVITLSIVFIITSISFLVVLLYILNKTCNYTLDIYTLFKEHSIIFVFIALIEYIFFTQIAAKYHPISSSELTNSIITSFQNYLNHN